MQPRKRTQHQEASPKDTKRTKSNNEETYQCEILIPKDIPSVLIGTVKDQILVNYPCASIDLRNAQDCYPGKSGHICLIRGNMPMILQVIGLIIDTETQNCDKKINVIVPNALANIIISTAMNYIKLITETTGSNVRFIQTDMNNFKRCITIHGTRSAILKACELIVSKLFKQPVINNPMNMSLPLQLLENIKIQLKSRGYSDAQVLEVYSALSVLAKHGLLSMNFSLNSNMLLKNR